MTHLANLSVDSGVFPKCWKVGNITPIHKKGSKLEVDNYRPIILMSNLGKLLESIVLENVQPILDKLLPDTMHGFRPNKGTETAVTTMLEDIKEKKKNKLKVAILALYC